jgi:hypothetical protein
MVNYMLRIGVGELQRKIGYLQDLALVEPITITDNGCDLLVLMSADEYRRLKNRNRQVMTLDDFTNEDVAALEKVRHRSKRWPLTMKLIPKRLPTPKPLPSQVVRYSYLWDSERRRGQEEGVKDRPCAVVLLMKNADGADVVTVLPITRTPPATSHRDLAIEIPIITKRRLGLDDKRSWIILSEANRITLPCPELRIATDDDPNSGVYSMLPEKLFERVRLGFIAGLKSRQATLMERTE